MTSENSDRLNRTELEALYADYFHELQAFLRGVLRDVDLVADALQTTYIKVVEKGETAERKTFKGWLFKVALNEARGLIRKRQQEEKFRTHSVWTKLSQQNEFDETGEESLIRRESIEALRRFIEQLPLEQQQVLKLRMADELTFAEIAKALNLPLGTVLTRMRLAIQKLKIRLQQYDSES